MLKTSKSRTRYGHLWNTLRGIKERRNKRCGISTSHLILLKRTPEVSAAHGAADPSCSRNTLVQFRVGSISDQSHLLATTLPPYTTHTGQGPWVHPGYAWATEDRTNTLSENTSRKHPTSNFKGMLCQYMLQLMTWSHQLPTGFSFALGEYSKSLRN